MRLNQKAEEESLPEVSTCLHQKTAPPPPNTLKLDVWFSLTSTVAELQAGTDQNRDVIETAFSVCTKQLPEPDGQEVGAWGRLRCPQGPAKCARTDMNVFSCEKVHKRAAKRLIAND